MNWPLAIALLLIVLKQLYKLYIYHKPDRVDYLKALATLPMDVSFLVVGLFIKAAMQPTSSAEVLVGLMVVYLILGLFSTILWRICESAVKNSLGGNFIWAFPLNSAMTVSTFYLATQYVK